MRRFLVMIGETDVRELARLALLRLGRWLGRAGVRLQAAALRSAGVVGVGVAERKVPALASPPAAEPIAVPGPVETPLAVKRVHWRLPTPDEVDRARGDCSAHALAHLKNCRGPGKGCARLGWEEQKTCPDCFLVHWHDRRPSADIVEAMERGDA